MTFEEIYEGRPDKAEVGSSGYSRMKHLYDICKKIEPTVIIQSGEWKGNSTWLFRHTCPDAQIISYDIDLSNRMWEDNQTWYVESDWLEDEVQCLDEDKTLLFFDDHVNQEQRLAEAKKLGYKHVIFNDNIPFHELEKFKAPPIPTLEMLNYEGNLPSYVKEYKVLEKLNEKETRNTYLTYVRIYQKRARAMDGSNA